MALTVNRDLEHYVDQELRSLPVAAAKRIFKGAFVGLSPAGFARPLEAGDSFAGIAYEEKDNTTGQNGDLAVRVYTMGDFGVPLAGAVAAFVGRPVFAGNDETLTFDGAGNSFVGVVQDVPENGQILLRIEPGAGRIKTVVHVVEDLTAGLDFTARAMHAFGQAAWITAARVVNQGTAAAGINDANTCVVQLTIGAATVASKTFDTANTFPAVNASAGMGTIAAPRAAAGSVLNIAVTNGTSANPGPFLVEVDYL